MTHAHTRIIASLGLVALLGFGCEAPKEEQAGAQGSTNTTAEVGTESPAPSDSEPVVSGEGKAVYENKEWRVKFEYPKGWILKEETNSQSLFTGLHPGPLPQGETDAMFQYSVTGELRPLESIIAEFEGATKVGEFVVNGVTFVKFNYYVEFTDTDETLYLTEQSNKTYRVTGPKNDAFLEVLLSDLSTSLLGR